MHRFILYRVPNDALRSVATAEIIANRIFNKNRIKNNYLNILPIDFTQAFEKGICPSSNCSDELKEFLNEFSRYVPKNYFREEYDTNTLSFSKIIKKKFIKLLLLINRMHTENSSFCGTYDLDYLGLLINILEIERGRNQLIHKYLDTIYTFKARFPISYGLETELKISPEYFNVDPTQLSINDLLDLEVSVLKMNRMIEKIIDYLYRFRRLIETNEKAKIIVIDPDEHGIGIKHSKFREEEVL